MARRRYQFLRGKFEPLEPRIVLDGGLGLEYMSVSAAWFEQVAPDRASDFHAGSQSVASSLSIDDGSTAGSRWIVRLTAEATASSANVLDAARALNTSSITFAPLLGLGLPGLILVEADASPGKVTAALASNNRVAYFESDGTIGAELFPNDPQISEQVGLHNSGQSGGTSDADIDAPEAWDITTGSDQVVLAVIDTGIDYTHPDLAANMWVNPNETPGNGIDDDNNGFIDDVYGYDFRNNDGDPFDDHRHGTHVAGTIAAEGNNGIGVSGVTWNSKLMALKFLDQNNQGQTADAVRAINYATMMRGEGVNIRAINASWGSGEFSRALNDAITASGQADILLVAAAGNGDVLGRGLDNDRQPFYPASYDQDTIIAVAASGPDDRLAPFSNFGKNSVDLVAPGIGIISTEPGGTYASRNGTSMATPHVTGVAALVAALRPESSARDLRAAILNSVDLRASVDGRVGTGGRLNANRALLVDGIAPQFVSISSVANITVEAASSQQFTVSYSDNVAVDVSSLDFADLVVTRFGDESFSTAVNLISRSHLNDGANRSAVYDIPGPGGVWDHTDNGQYLISLAPNQVADTSGNTAAPKPLFTFTVDIPAPPPIERVFYVTSFEDAPDTNPGDGIADDGTGHTTLRAAIMETNALPGADTIILPAGTFEMTIGGRNENLAATGDYDILGDLTIEGAGQSQTILEANDIDRMFDQSVGNTTFTIRNLTIQNGFDSASSSAGIFSIGALVVEHVAFRSNESNGSGAMRHSGGQLIVRDSLFDANFASGTGGAIYAAGANTTIERTTFSNNVATVNGGAITSVSDHMTISDSQFVGNRTDRAGSAISIQSFGANTDIIRTTFTGNLGNLGVIQAIGNVTMIDSEAANNSGIVFGTFDGITRNLTVQRSWLHDNAGGIAISASATVLVEDSLINHNANGSTAGAIAVSGSSAHVIVRNSTITDNTAPIGALRIWSNASAEIDSSTIVGNHGVGAGVTPGGIDARTALNVTLHNSVVSGNTSDGGLFDGIDLNGAFTSAGYNLIGVIGDATGFTDGVNGDHVTNDLNNPPDLKLSALIDNGGLLKTLAPLPGSPLLDAGDPATTLTFDQRGAARKLDADGDTNAVADIGAVEFGTFFINSTADTVDANPGDGDAKDASGNRTLRSVIQEANNLPGETIAVLPAGTYTLSLASTGEDAAADGDLDVTGDVKIIGAGKSSTYIDANDIDRVFHVLGGGKLQLEDVTIQGGFVTGDGAGVLNVGELSLLRTTLTGNDATGSGSGGAVHNSGTLNVTDSVLTANAAASDGGGIANTATTVIQASTLYDNIATGHGAGMANFGAAAVLGLVNVTLSGNVATDSGGGLFNDGAATANLTNVTLAENATSQSGGGIMNANGTVNLGNTIVATNMATVADPDLSGVFVSSSNNLIGDLGAATGLADQANGDQVGNSTTAVDPKIGPLRDNAAQTPTHALRIGSPAIDAGDDGDAAAADQRGTTRPQDGDGDDDSISDIGAFEFSASFAASLAGLVFFDANGNGTKDENEEGLAGWKIFLDLNNNSTLDVGELSTITIADDPATTSINEAGTYLFPHVDPDGYTVAIESQIGWTQTFPAASGTHGINLEPGEVRTGVNFGQAADVGRIQGSLFHDRDSDGAIDAGEIPLSGWTVFLDRNNNDRLDVGETSLTTDESGAFDFANLTPLTTYTVAAVEQPGWLHTDPARVFAVGAPHSIATARPSRSVMVADLNSDSILDLVIANPSLGNVSVMIGAGDGTFAAPTQLSDGTEPVSVAAADIDNDGDVDLIVVNRGSDDISVFRNNGSGGYTPAGKLDAGETPVKAITADFTGDGVPDIAILSSTGAATDNLWLYANDGSGLFGNAQRNEIGASPSDFTSGDIDGDGDTDLVIARETDDALVLLLNQGTGTFAATTPIAVGTSPTAVTVGDFNGDGRLDVATANAGSDNVSLLLNEGGGAFAPAVSISAGEQPAGIIAVDLDRDGTLDLVTANVASADVVVLLNQGPATFAAPIAVSVGGAIESLAFGDVDGDHDADLFVAGSGLTNEVKLIANELSRPVFEITLGPGQTVSERTFGFRARLGRIQGQEFHDLNGDGIKDATDLPLVDWTVYLDRNNNGRLDTNEPSTVTDENGLYVFSDLEPLVEYTVIQIIQDGWQQTSPRSPFGFESPVEIGVGDGPHSIAAGDINADGLPDLVVANIDSDTLTILLNSSDGGFTAALNLPTGDAPAFPSLGDLDGDGDLDLAWVNQGSKDVSVSFNDGLGSFGGARRLSAGDTPTALTIADLDRNATLDLAVTDGTGGVSLLFNSGAGEFAAPVLLLGPGANAIVTADLDGDGDRDIATVDTVGAQVSFYRNNGGGAFEPPINTPVPGANPRSLALGDVDNDGDIDLATETRILRNQGNGTLVVGNSFGAGSSAKWVALRDIDDDGNSDAIITRLLTGDIAVARGQGDGTFAAPITFSVGQEPNFVVVGDWNGDNSPDLAVANNSGDSVTILKNQQTPLNHSVTLDAGGIAANIDFGNRLVQGQGGAGAGEGTITGRSYADLNGNARFDPGEPGLSGDLVWVDFDRDGVLDIDEPSTLTLADDLGTTDVDESGWYEFTGLPVNDYLLRIAPSVGRQQTGPLNVSLVTTQYATGDGPRFVYAADLDGDTFLDLAVANATTNNISILRNKQDGTFMPAATFGVGNTGLSPSSLSPADVTGDGKLDLLVANLYSGNVSLLQGDGTATFSATGTVQAGVLTSSLSTGDFNGDSKPDVAVTNSASNTVSVFLNDGSGGLSAAVSYAVGEGPESIVTVDVNGDGHDDLAVTEFDSHSVSILVNTGNGTFSRTATLPVGSGPFSVIAADINQDGHPDLVVANVLSDNVSVLLNDGSGGFMTPHQFAAGTGPSSIAAADFDADGDIDLAVTNGTSTNLSMLLNDGSGRFSAALTFGVGDFPDSLPFSVTAGDFDQDGVMDLAVAQGNFDLVSVMKNSLTPGAQHVSIRQEETISGVDFGVVIINELPTLAPIADLSGISEDAPSQMISLTGVSAGGAESQLLRFTVSSSNPALIPAPVVAYTQGAAEATLEFDPIDDSSGTSVIAVTLMDAGPDGDFNTTIDNRSVVRSFTITVLSVNDAPTLLSVDDVTVGEDAPEQTVALTGISAGGGESQPLSILATSDNVSLIANPTVVYTSGDTSGSLRFTPTADLSGSAIITVTLTDGGLDQNLTTTSDNGVTQRSFTITVQAVNDVPTIDATADLPALSEDASEQIVSLHGLSAGEGEDQPLRVIATSTNQTLIPNPTVDFIDGQSVATLRFTPIANRSGTSVITVIVTDGGLDRDLNTAADNATVETTFLVVVNSGNDEVTLDPISNPVAVKEDSSAQVVALTGISAGAGESQPLSITAVSSNVSLTGQLIVDYESPNQTATIRYTPVADQSGQATITVTVTDGGLDGDLQTSDDNASLSRNFTITVDAENDSPTLDPLDSFSIEEEATGQVISLTGISAGGGESQLLRVSAISSLPSLIPHPIVTYTSAQSSGTLNLRPMPNQSGEAVITVTVTDAGLDGDINLTTDNGTVSRVFTVTVDAVNDPPALNAISNLEINEDAPTQTVNLSGISAGGGESQPLSITVSSDNPGLIPTPSVQYISPNTIGAIQFAPVKDQHGTAVITLTLTDGGLDGDISTGADNLSSVRTFAVTVNSENDPPSFEALSQISIAENAAVQRIVLTGISAGGGENQPLSVVAISNQPSLIQSPTVDYVSGEATAEVSFQPAAAASGVATIALTLTDGGLDGDLDTEEDNGSTTRVLTVAVRPVNDLPTLDQPINVTINEDSGEHMVLLTGVTAGPGESQPLSVTLRADREDLISNRSLEYVSPNDVATLRFTSAPDTSGVVVFTTTVTDGGLDGDLATTSDNASVERAFTVYIAPVNDPPTLNAISNLSLPEDAAEQAVNLAGITSGPGENQPLLVNVSSSNPSLIPAPTVQYISPSGTGSIRLQPAPNQSGFAVITVKVIDGGLDNDLATAFDNRTAEQSFTVAVAAENDLPTLDAITSFEIMENSPTRTIDLTGISAGGGEFQPLEITATSSNPQLIPAPSVQYSSPTTFGSVRLTPNANQQGTAVIGITLTDGGLDGDLSTLADNRSVTQSFTVVVLGQNQPPTFSAPSQLNILEDAPLQTVALTNIRDDGAQGQPLGLVVASTDPTLIPTPTLSYEAGSSTAEIRFAPVAGASGQATISLIVSDGGLDNDLATTEDNASTVHSILVTVVPVNDAPSLDPISDLTLDEDSGEHAITLTGITAGADESQPLNVTVRADRDDLIPTRTVEYATPSGQATFRFAPAFNVTGPVVFTATVTDGGLDGDLATSTDNASIERSFTVHVAPVNDPPTLDAISNVNLLENAAEHAVNLGGITAGPSENQPLQVNVSSSNPNLLPSLAVQYVSPSSFGSIRFQPAVNQSGSAIVTVTVMDGGLDGNLATTTDNLMTQQTFTVDVAPVNHPPTLTINLQEDAPEQVISLTEIGAGEGESQPLLISAVSDNPDLIPEPTIDYVASATSGFLRFTPASDKHGTAIIRVSVTDGGLDQDLATTADNATLNRFLTVIVASVNDPPSFMPLSDVQLADLATLTIPIEAISAGPGEQQNLRITATSSDTTILSHPSVTYTSPDEAGTLLLQPIAGSVKSGDFVPVLVTIFLEDAGLDGDFATVGDNRLFERTLTATIISSNQPPTGLRLSVSSIAEGPALSTARIVGTLAADDDSSDQLVYALAAGQGDEDNGKFEITEDVLAIKPNALVDFESESELSVRISATDSGGLSEVVIFKITVTDENDWHNVALPLDVNKSSTVEPLDVLILINWLNAKGTSALPGVAGEPEYFLDTNNDGQVSPLDALLIINRLNNSQSEGEATYLTAPVSLSVTPEWHAVSQIVNSGKSPKVESQDFMRPQNEHRVSSKTDHAGRSREAFTRQIDLVFAEIDSTHSWIELWDKELVDDQ